MTIWICFGLFYRFGKPKFAHYPENMQKPKNCCFFEKFVPFVFRLTRPLKLSKKCILIWLAPVDNALWANQFCASFLDFSNLPQLLGKFCSDYRVQRTILHRKAYFKHFFGQIRPFYEWKMDKTLEFSEKCPKFKMAATGPFLRISSWNFGNPHGFTYRMSE